jgi:glutamate carboxypeptidase
MRLRKSLILLVLALTLAPSLGISATKAVESIPTPWLTLLKDLVEINSGTENVDGLNQVRQRLIPEFEALGFKLTTHELANRRKVLSFERPGAQPQLLLLGHIDTVFSPSSSFQHFSQTPDSLQGPGVIDMKGGVVLILHLLSELSHRKDEKLLRQIRIVINDDEEIGSPDSMEKLKELAKGIPYGLLYEPGLQDGGVITSLSGLHWLELTVKGKAAHAGLDFAKGLNACAALSAKLAEIAKLTKLERKLTVNIGTIEGGMKPNVVCESAKAMLDVRYVDPKDRDQLLQKIRTITAKADGFNSTLNEAPVAEVKITSGIPSMTSASTEAVFRAAREVAKEQGLPFKNGHASYVTDGNRLAPLGISLLIGMGPSGSGMHSSQETMNISSYFERLQLNLGLVKKLLSP